MTTNKDISNGFVISCLLVIVLLAAEGKTDDDEEPISNIKKLKKDLMFQYDKYARPVKNASIAVPVLIKMGRIALAELNEFEQKLVLEAVLSMAWMDEYLQWDPNKYKGISEMIFPQDEIWHPEIVIYNSAPTTNNLPWNNSHMVVHSNGHISWSPPASISLRCPMPLLQTMEERTCNLSMATYLDLKIDLILSPAKIGKEGVQDHNPVWKITNFNASLRVIHVDTEDLSVATFTISIKSRNDFVSYVVQGPRTISILLTLAMFWLPSTSDKKLNLGCLVLLVLAGMILYLSSTVISPSLLATTVAQLRITLFTITSALLIEVTIINLSRLSDIVRPPPVLVRILSGMVGRVIGVCSRLEYKEDGGTVRLPEIQEEEISQPAITIEEEWALIAMALDRIFFVIYAAIFIIIST